MTEKTFLGEFEQMVLLAILRIGDNAYAVPIRGEIEERAERGVSRGALYTTLERLEAKGFVASISWGTRHPSAADARDAPIPWLRPASRLWRTPAPRWRVSGRDSIP